MSYLQRPPCAELRPFVACLWHQEAPAAAAGGEPTRVLPWPGVELLVNFGDPFAQIGGLGRLPPVQRLGPRTRVIDVRATGATGLVIARCRPWAAERLFQGSARCRVDGFDDRDADGLADEVARAASPDARLDLVEAHLLRVFGREEPDGMVRAAVASIDRRSGAIRIDALAAHLGVSRRHLHRRFHRAVGLGPKRFARVVRSQRALGLLRAGVSVDDTVDRCGYSDQAHLIGDLRDNTGLTPGAILRRPVTPLMQFYNSSHPDTLDGTAYL